MAPPTPAGEVYREHAPPGCSPWGSCRRAAATEGDCGFICGICRMAGPAPSHMTPSVSAAPSHLPQGEDPF